MKRQSIILLLCALQPFVAGAAEGWPAGNATLGKALHDKSCLACHARMYGGDGTKIYTRAGRMISDKSELVQRVAGCNAQFNLGLFPEDEAHIADYLNEQYYKFK